MDQGIPQMRKGGLSADLKLSRRRIGLLTNFNVVQTREGIKRVIL